MASSGIMKAMCLVLITVALVAPLAKAAISCNKVVSSVRPCLLYVLGGNKLPSACCDGIKTLYASAQTTPDRQSVCNCLKSFIGSFKLVKVSKAAGLPGKCGVNIPYKIDPSTDCSTVQ